MLNLSSFACHDPKLVGVAGFMYEFFFEKGAPRPFQKKIHTQIQQCHLVNKRRNEITY